MTEEKEEFLAKFMKFYKDLVVSSSEAIEELAEIQEDYPEHYQEFREVQHDPQEVLETADEMDEQTKNVLLTTIIRASNLGQRTNHVFQTEPQEKEQLSEDLRDFGNFVENKIQEMNSEDRQNE